VAAKVKLHDLVEGLEFESDIQSSYVDRETGEVLVIMKEFLSYAEEEAAPEDSAPQWQVDAYQEALQVVQNPDRYLRVPSQFEIHEYSIMEDFCHSVEDQKIRNELLNAIRGRGAFRYFKDTIYRYGIQDSWDTFRDEALRDIAKEWCEDNGIAYE
jgi:hypothetical protein